MTWPYRSDHFQSKWRRHLMGTTSMKKKKITASNLKFFPWNYSLFKTKLQTVTKILPSLNDVFDLTVIFYAPFDVCNV